MRNCCQFLWSVTKANPSVDNRLCSTPQKRCEYVLKISWKLEQSSIIRSESALKTSLQDVLKMSWRRLQNVSKASWRCLEDVLKTSWRCLEDVFARRLEDVLKMSWRRFSRRLEDVLKTSWRCLEDVFAIRLEDVLKKSWSIFVLIKTSWRRLEEVFWRRRQKTSSRRLHQDECLLGYLLNYSIKANLYIVLVWFLGPHSCIFDKLSGEVSDLKLSKNVKVMFIFNAKLFY